MKKKMTSIMIVTAFLVGFGLGGLSLHYASAQGMFGISTSVNQLINGADIVDTTWFHTTRGQRPSPPINHFLPHDQF